MAVVEGTREGRIGWITFRRPEKLNALNPAAFDEFSALMDLMGFSETIKAGAEFDPIAHDAPRLVAINDEVRELGLKGAITWVETEA